MKPYDFEAVTILVTDKEGGLVFEGQPCHWRDVFFDNAFPNVILDYCLSEGWTVRFTPSA